MRRAFLLIVLGGVLAALLAAVLVRPSLGFTLGVPREGVAAVVPPGRTVCQRPVSVPPHGEFDRLTLSLGTYHRPGPPLRVTLRDDRSGRTLASGHVRSGYPDIGEQPKHTVRVGKVTALQRLRVCVTNDGDHRVAIYGAGGAHDATSAAYLDGRRLTTDVDLRFERGARPLIAEAPAVAERAALFRSRWAGPWTYGALLLVVVIAVPGLLAHALARLREEPPQ